jgi:glutathione synthase/RimK-type ligase-like ATP-grasp enzyme
MKIAFVVFDNYGKYLNPGDNEDLVLAELLKNDGHQLQLCDWKDANINWAAFDVVIIKSPWDYFNHKLAFKAWLEQLESLKVKVLNPIAILKKNIDKHYLKEIAVAGFNIPESYFTSLGETIDFEKFFERWNTKKIIVKPCISGGAHHTFSLKMDDIESFIPTWKTLSAEEEFLIQPFIPEIQTKGEWSLIYFGGKFSHAVLKTTAPGDYRVQFHFGGNSILANPSENTLTTAQQLVNIFAKNCLYARVDGIETSNGFQLMELELTEPLLFLKDYPEGYQNYLEALRSGF